MKQLLFLILIVFFGTNNALCQVTGNFEGPGLSSGTTACWDGAQDYAAAWGKGVSPRNPVSMVPIFSINTTSPITGTGSLTVSDTFVTDGTENITFLFDKLYAPAFGVDGDSVFFNLRVNNLVVPVATDHIEVSITAGDFSQTTNYGTSYIGAGVVPVSAVIANSNGGGVITISIVLAANYEDVSFGYSAVPGEVNLYVVDIDDFYTTAAADPANTCASMIPLPVKLLSFDARKNYDHTALNWITATEQHNSGFEIQRSTNGTDWNKIAFVNSKNGGNSDMQQSYVYEDNDPLPGINYYRLKQNDPGHEAFYSKVCTVNFGAVTGHISFSPNPASGNVNVSGLKEGTLVQLYDMYGKLLISQKATGAAAQLDIENLAAGIYLVATRDETGRLQTGSITKR